MASDDENRDMWTELRLQRDILIELRTMTQSVMNAKDDHEVRIRKLEERKFPLPTVAVGISLAALVATVLSMMLSVAK